MQKRLKRVAFFGEIMKNVIYLSNLCKIGGLETFIYELAKKYDYDITLMYNRADENQLKRLIKLIPCIQYNKQQFKCKRLFVNNETSILDTVEANEVIQMIHGLYKTQGIEPNLDPRVNSRIAVSKAAANEYYELTGIMPRVYYNPLTITDDDKSPVLYLISATRLTSEKGGDRMLKLANMLDKNNIKYIWLVFTNDEVYEFTNNMVKLKPTLDIRPYIASIKGKGYGVQLSDCEGDPYFTKECQALGVPVLITPVLSFFEQGLEDGKNCYVLPFDMKDIDIDKIVNKIPQFNPYIREDKWDELLVHYKTNYREELKMKYKVKALNTYKELGLKDGELGFIPDEGYEFEVDKIRLDILLGNNAYATPFVELVEEKEKPKKKK